jgi:hypothetical protein
MSHLIVARGEDRRPLACLEMSLCGPTWLERTGFDVYAAYNALHLNNGLCGKGDEVSVDEATARAAHRQALEWVKRLDRRGQVSQAVRYSFERMEDVLRFTLEVCRAAETGWVAIRFA